MRGIQLLGISALDVLAGKAHTFRGLQLGEELCKTQCLAGNDYIFSPIVFF